MKILIQGNLLHISKFMIYCIEFASEAAILEGALGGFGLAFQEPVRWYMCQINMVLYIFYNDCRKYLARTIVLLAGVTNL